MVLKLRKTAGETPALRKARVLQSSLSLPLPGCDSS